MGGQRELTPKWLYVVVLDEATLPRVSADADHERAVAIFDLVEEKYCGAIGRDGRSTGPGRVRRSGRGRTPCISYMSLYHTIFTGIT